MITFKGRQQVIRSADTIGRMAHGTYSHLSCSNICTRYRKVHHLSRYSFDPLPEYYSTVGSKILQLRTKVIESMDYFSTLVNEIKENQAGNCFEEAMLAELIGHINGQHNIFVGNVYVKKQNVKNEKSISHAVALVTDKKPPKSEKGWSFKNNDAIIIDPWLNIVDWAGNYFTKIKNQYKTFFDELPNQDFLEYMIGVDSKNIREFREQRKKSCQGLKFSIKPALMIHWDKNKEELYRSKFPELIIEKYQKIIFPKKKKNKQKINT